MGTHPVDEAAIKYEELRVLAAYYGKKLDAGSYGDFICTVDRLVELRDMAKKLWGDR